MRKLYGIILGLFFFVVGFSAAIAEATQMSSVSVSRSIETTISEYGYADVVDSDVVAGYLPYNNTVSATNGGIPSSNGSADQNSWINMASDTIHASGTAYGDSAWSGFTGGVSVMSYSGFQYTFDVLSPSDYLFGGNGSAVRIVMDSLEAEVYADIHATLRDVTNSTYLHSFSVAYDGSYAFNYSGTLAPARYQVSVNGAVDVWSSYSEQFVDATASYSMNFRLAPAGTGTTVPEPSASVLLLLGLTALTAMRRRRDS